MAPIEGLLFFYETMPYGGESSGLTLHDLYKLSVLSLSLHIMMDCFSEIGTILYFPMEIILRFLSGNSHGYIPHGYQQKRLSKNIHISLVFPSYVKRSSL